MRKMQGKSPQSWCHILLPPFSGKGGRVLKMYNSLFTLRLKLNTGFFKLYPLLLYTISSVDKLKLAIGPTLLLTYFACNSAAEINLVQ